jgi:polyisoprenyl-phosphate glycosyltransferase
MSGKKLLIVIPCYNEEEALPSTLKRMETLMNKMLGEKLIDKNSRVMFVDDGSADNTWQILKKGVGKTPFFEALRLSRNFGHQSAILAGMFDNEADIYVTIDADLQDDPDCIVEMLQVKKKLKCRYMEIKISSLNNGSSRMCLSLPLLLMFIFQ